MTWILHAVSLGHASVPLASGATEGRLAGETPVCPGASSMPGVISVTGTKFTVEMVIVQDPRQKDDKTVSAS